MKFKTGDLVKLKEESVTHPYERGSIYTVHEINKLETSQSEYIVAYMHKGNGLVADKVRIEVYPSALEKVEV